MRAPMCCKSTKLDIQGLIDRLGRDHGSMHDDLVGLFICSNCKAAGRDRRPVFFTCIPDYEGQQRARNRDWKPTFERRAESGPASLQASSGPAAYGWEGDRRA